MKRLINYLALMGLILISCNSNYNKIDLHVHLNRSARLTGNSAAEAYQQASELSIQKGIIFGIAEELDDNDKRMNDSVLIEHITLARKKSLYIGIQVSRRDWQNIYSKKVLDQLDFILADALIFPNKEGVMMQIWNSDQPIGKPQEFMDMYVDYNLKVLSEPITIWANPSLLPVELISRYDELWTDARMKRLIDVAVKNNVAIEINSRFKVPHTKFIKMAKSAGAHFTFGSNRHDATASDIYWSIKMAKKCGLKKGDFFIPKRQLLLD